MDPLPRFKKALHATWAWYLAQSAFVRAILLVPIVCGLLMTFLIGNMGLALMGTAVAINAFLAGWIGGAIAVVVSKALQIIARDGRHSR
ncbi:hypothetical protein [Rhodovulum sp. MB263]|uniref:hypothetical protein n=1 Tax=Rhodovulum sp. (strain MB263) TaxID=308754 RepID=UPI0009B763BA|nr:hypothetical protein [Rhodovulum sp. MB263]ARC89633.1 hypothetical protein B5V46_13990 [Rhodovulum sp. MB263]